MKLHKISKITIMCVIIINLLYCMKYNVFGEKAERPGLINSSTSIVREENVKNEELQNQIEITENEYASQNEIEERDEKNTNILLIVGVTGLVIAIILFLIGRRYK